MLGGIITIVGGLLAASSFIVARKPNAKELIDKLVPYQGIVGASMFLWGIWDLLHMIRLLSVFSVAPVHYLLVLAAIATDIGVGFLLAFGLISKYALSKNEKAMAKGQALRGRLVKFQVPLGFLAMAFGVLCIVL